MRRSRVESRPTKRASPAHMNSPLVRERPIFFIMSNPSYINFYDFYSLQYYCFSTNFIELPFQYISTPNYRHCMIDAELTICIEYDSEKK